MQNPISAPLPLLLNGAWRPTDTTLDVRDKFDNTLFARVCVAGREEVGQAVAGAKSALEDGPPPPHERAAILYRAAALLDQYRDLFVETIVTETGFTISDAAGEVSRARLTLELSSETAKTFTGQTVPFGAHPGSEERIGFTLRDPIGVVCAITPFNSPLNTVLHKIGPSFAAGNPTVLKPSSLTPVSSHILGELFLEAGMPAGYLQIVHGDGGVGNFLLEEQDVAFYTFTGSTRVGRIIQSHAGLRRTQMELGSIASTILCEDADLDRALPRIANAGLRKAGQVCTSVQRLYVQRDIHDTAIARLGELARAMRCGNPHEAATQVGPMISRAAAERAEAWIADAVRAGATLHCGGTREGSVVRPTLLTSVPETTEAWNQEAFAPLIVVKPFDTQEEAFKSANSTPYGLAAGVFTNSMSTAMTAMKTLKFGTVQINETSSARADVMPFGGVKDSGFGKEGPHYAAQEMSIERLIVLNP